jgi:hypothetical protein
LTSPTAPYIAPPVGDPYDRAERRFRRTVSLGLAIALVLGVVIIILLLLLCLEASAVAGLGR